MIPYVNELFEGRTICEIHTIKRLYLTPTKSFGSVCSSYGFRAGARNNLAPEGQETTFLGPCAPLTFLGQGQEITLPLQGHETTLPLQKCTGPQQELERGAR